MKYKHIAIGGTFDLLHLGHQEFIEHAFSLGERVTIGITSDTLVRKLKGGSLTDFDNRFKSVCNFVKLNKFSSQASIIQLDDFFGPTLKDKTIDCLLATKDSLAGVKMINEERIKLGLRALPVEIFSLVLGQDKKTISSKRIKSGTINRQGLNYYEYLIKKGDLRLPENLRVVLRKPFGKVYKDLKKIKHMKDKMSLVATVGDFTTQGFLRHGLFFNLSLIDFKIQRVDSFKKVEDLGFSGEEKIIKVANPPGIVSRALVKALNTSLNEISNNKKIIVIDGEEDLAVLVLCLLAPLNSVIYYGLRNRGMIETVVDLNLKDKLQSLIDLFGYDD